VLVLFALLIIAALSGSGLALGWGWFALCSIAFGGRMLRFGDLAEPDKTSTPQLAKRDSNPAGGAFVRRCRTA
jgi:hypothetical protein